MKGVIMARSVVYGLFDRKLREYAGGLMLERNDDAIVRSVQTGVRGSGSMVEKYPEDFDLMAVGEFESETGELVVLGSPRLVENLLTLCPPSSNGDGA